MTAFAGIAAVLYVVAACSSDAVVKTPVPTSPALYNQPYAPAIKQQAQWISQGRKLDARQIGKIINQPTATWIQVNPALAQIQVARITQKAAAVNKLPVLVAYAIPNRDCGSYSAGGHANFDGYLDWIRHLVVGLGNRPALIILEPDAVADSLGRCGMDASERYRVLGQAITQLKRDPKARVYLDAGNPRWVGDLPKLADALRQSNIGQADGFSLNVSNFIATEENINYGTRLSQLLGDIHFVIDTSRNGLGPTTDNAWCNPPGRALGETPSMSTGVPFVDAYLWVKPPGESDGDCGRGEPPPGAWDPEYALSLAQSTPG